MSEDTRQYLTMVVLVVLVTMPAAYTVLVIVMNDLRRNPRDNDRIEPPSSDPAVTVLHQPTMVEPLFRMPVKDTENVESGDNHDREPT